MAPVVKNPPANAEGIRELGSIPGSRRSPGEGNGYLFRYSCLENPMDRGAWWATVHGVAKSRTQLSKAQQQHTIQNLYKFIFTNLFILYKFEFIQ